MASYIGTPDHTFAVSDISGDTVNKCKFLVPQLYACPLTVLPGEFSNADSAKKTKIPYLILRGKRVIAYTVHLFL